MLSVGLAVSRVGRWLCWWRLARCASLRTTTLMPSDEPAAAVRGIVFRPQRYTLEALHQDEPRPPQRHEDGRLTYAFRGGESLVLRRLLEDHGYLPSPTADADLVWSSGHVGPETLLSLPRHAKVNHFPRSGVITRKDLLVRTIAMLRARCGRAAYEYLPLSFVLPADAAACTAAMGRDGGATWIAKPIASSQGRGISLLGSSAKLPVGEDCVVSRYVARPLLIDGCEIARDWPRCGPRCGPRWPSCREMTRDGARDCPRCGRDGPILPS